MSEPQHSEQEWTDKQLHELVMELRVETGYLESRHRRFYDLLKPWFDKHNAALALDKHDAEVRKPLVNKQAEQLLSAQAAIEKARELLDAYSESEKPAVDTLSEIEAVLFPETGEGEQVSEPQRSERRPV